MSTSKKLASAAAAFTLGRLAWAFAKRRRRGVRLRGGTAVVCGASRGLGRAIALELARRGVAKIAICARSAHDLDAVAAELVRRGVHVCAEACDLSKLEDTERFIGSASGRLGPIDVLVTNAATIGVSPAAMLTERDFEDALASTFYTALHPILAAMPGMRLRRHGTIAVVTSIGGRIGVPHLAPYCTAKFATMGLVESLRSELAADDVNVLAVVPGLVRTGSHVRASFKGAHELEYAWFGASAMAPIISIDADRAARRIVAAIARGDVEVAFTPEAKMAPIVRALAPEFWAEILAVVARLLPNSPADVPHANEWKEGLAIEEASRSRVVASVRARGRSFARQHGQVG